MFFFQSFDTILVDGPLKDALDDLLQHTGCLQVEILPSFVRVIIFE